MEGFMDSSLDLFALLEDEVPSELPQALNFIFRPLPLTFTSDFWLSLLPYSSDPGWLVIDFYSRLFALDLFIALCPSVFAWKFFLPFLFHNFTPGVHSSILPYNCALGFWPRVCILHISAPVLAINLCYSCFIGIWPSGLPKNSFIMHLPLDICCRLLP